MANILIVDDSTTARKLVRYILESHGHTIAGEASDGAMAIHLYETLRPDIVLLDIVMPEMDGLECLREIKKRDMWAKVIIVSASGTVSVMRRASEYGCADFITKPFDAKRLLNSIHVICE